MFSFESPVCALHWMLPPNIKFAVTEGEFQLQYLYPEEQRTIAGAVDKRVREFSVGRSCARQVLQDLGCPAQPILTDADRAPIWPRGIVGSLSHSEGLCVAIGCHHGAVLGVGIDVEPIRNLATDIVPIICSPAELAHISSLPQVADVDLALAVFCAKEAVYKSVFPLLRRFMEFHDVEVRLCPAEGRFSARLTDPRLEAFVRPLIPDGRLVMTPLHIIAAAAVHAPADSLRLTTTPLSPTMVRHAKPEYDA
jgi:enterobactin synthetase component D / holo-[acyl-carrier protein] synthase